jgi:lipopolysaccharide transport system ATP-binding protein
MPAITVENVSKKYLVGGEARRHRTFYELLADRLHVTARRDVRPESNRDVFWALQDVNFEVRPGDALGIVGRNGAGKSTLLKILSRITEPTHGTVRLRGRVGSLLEVGTGFHPELSGRENVFLNGAILGMKRREILSKFEEIVDFAEVQRFIDTPVKRYSSGMLMRLAFAVAAHLDPDVLIADEVLAVGDLSFERKSIDKMEETVRSGRTVLFVSHNLGAVRRLCRTALLLEAGKLKHEGPVAETLRIYEAGLVNPQGALAAAEFRGPLSGDVRFEHFCCSQRGHEVGTVDPQERFQIELRGNTRRAFADLAINIRLYRDGFHLTDCYDAPPGTAVSEGPFVSTFEFAARSLKPGRYVIGIGAFTSHTHWIWGPDIAVLNVSENWGDGLWSREKGAVSLEYESLRRQ